MENHDTAGIDLDAAQLDKLEALARAATPGPWEATHQTDDECSFAGYFIEAKDKTISDDGTAPGAADALFIAAANPSTVLQLIQLARRSTSGSEPTDALAALDDMASEAADNGNSREPGGWWHTTYTTIRSALIQQASGSDGTAAAGIARQPAAAIRAAERVDAMHKGIVGVLAAIRAEHTATSGSELADERARFEAWAAERWEPQEISMRHKDAYLSVSLNSAWKAWQARAALAQQPGAHAEYVGKLRATLYAIANTLNDNELRAAAKEAYAAPAPAAQDEREMVVIGGRRVGRTYAANLERDAARYRWLRNCPPPGSEQARICLSCEAEEMDEEIDAAMSQSKTHGTAGQDGAA